MGSAHLATAGTSDHVLKRASAKRWAAQEQKGGKGTKRGRKERKAREESKKKRQTACHSDPPGAKQRRLSAYLSVMSAQRIFGDTYTTRKSLSFIVPKSPKELGKLGLARSPRGLCFVSIFKLQGGQEKEGNNNDERQATRTGSHHNTS